MGLHCWCWCKGTGGLLSSVAATTKDAVSACGGGRGAEASSNKENDPTSGSHILDVNLMFVDQAGWPLQSFLRFSLKSFDPTPGSIGMVVERMMLQICREATI